MLTNLYIIQLPNYRAQIIKQRNALQHAEGFTQAEKAELQEIYNNLITALDKHTGENDKLLPQLTVGQAAAIMAARFMDTDINDIELYEIDELTPQAN